MPIFGGVRAVVPMNSQNSQGDLPTSRREPPPPPPGRAYRSLGDISTSGTAARSLDGSVLAGKYRIERKLGEGGMGEVWQAHDTIGQRTVALKVLPAESQQNTREIERTRATFRRICELQHQHVCPTLDLGHDPAVGYFLVMKHIRGVSLSEYRRGYCAQQGAMPVAEIVRLLRPIAEALDYIHAQGILHRDVKPENILVVNQATDVQLVDFGLAGEIQQNLMGSSFGRPEVNGTYPYMSPEQWKGEYQDGRTDQYALAVVAYGLLSGGQLPFEGSDSRELRDRILHEPVPVIPGMPPALYKVLVQGLAKQSDKRFPSCLALVTALSVAGGAPAIAPPATKLPGSSGPNLNRPSAAPTRSPKPGSSTQAMPVARPSGPPPMPPQSTARGVSLPTPRHSDVPRPPLRLPAPLASAKLALEMRFGFDLFRGWKLALILAAVALVGLLTLGCLLGMLATRGYRPNFD